MKNFLIKIGFGAQDEFLRTVKGELFSPKQYIKQFILKRIYGYGTSEEYIAYLRRKGVTIGENVHFYAPNHTRIDTSRGYGVVIGDNVHITKGVTILTHGFDWCVTKTIYNDVLGSFGEVIIGNNVFIGVNTTILKGVHIGNNIIIAAGSNVVKDCLESGVYGGNPAKFISSISEYHDKRLKNQLNEAENLVNAYYRRYQVFPPKEELSEFYFLFEDRSLPIDKGFEYQMRNNGKFDECFRLYKEGHNQMFDNYNQFLKYCKQKIGED